MQIYAGGVPLTGKEIYEAFIAAGSSEKQYRPGLDCRWDYKKSSHFSGVIFSKKMISKADVVTGTKATLLIRSTGGNWEELDISPACSVILPPLLPETCYTEIQVRVGDGVLIHEHVAFSLILGGEALHSFLEAFRVNIDNAVLARKPTAESAASQMS